MSICRIVGAGDCDFLDFTAQREELIIAADGGLKHLEKHRIIPDLIIGDFDSLGMIPEGKNVTRLNPVKDITDMHAAALEGIKRGCDEFYFYGACGGRIDHTLANVQLLVQLVQKGFKASIYDGKAVITAIHNDSIVFDSSYKGYISVFSHTDKSDGVTVKGLKYEVENAEFSNSFPLGVSNEFTGKRSEISVKNGTLIIVHY